MRPKTHFPGLAQREADMVLAGFDRPIATYLLEYRQVARFLLYLTKSLYFPPDSKNHELCAFLMKDFKMVENG